MKRIEIIICVVLVVSAQHVCGRLPSTIRVCSRNDRHLAECIINSVKDLQPRLSHGNLAPDFRIPPIEPLTIENINIGRTPEFKCILRNLLVRGPSSFKIEKFRVNLNDLKFDFILNFPKLDIRGKYDLVFRLFGYALQGRGDIIASFENTRARISMRAKKIQKNGQVYLHFDRFGIKFVPGKQAIKLTNLFQGNPALEEIGNNFINTNSEFFLNDVYPSVEHDLSTTFTAIANRITSEASFDELFPDSYANQQYNGK